LASQIWSFIFIIILHVAACSGLFRHCLFCKFLPANVNHKSAKIQPIFYSPKWMLLSCSN